MQSVQAWFGDDVLEGFFTSKEIQNSAVLEPPLQVACEIQAHMRGGTSLGFGI